MIAALVLLFVDHFDRVSDLASRPGVRDAASSQECGCG